LIALAAIPLDFASTNTSGGDRTWLTPLAESRVLGNLMPSRRRRLTAHSESLSRRLPEDLES